MIRFHHDSYSIKHKHTLKGTAQEAEAGLEQPLKSDQAFLQA